MREQMSVAVVKHLNLTNEEIHLRNFRPTYALDLLIFRKIPSPPPNWQVKMQTSDGVSWLSTTGGQINFLMAKDTFPEGFIKTNSIGRDPESVRVGCPIVDVKTLFIMKLNSSLEVDMSELMTLARKTKIPKEIEKELWTNRQKKNLEFIRSWAELRL